jgi:hypothetical protein
VSRNDGSGNSPDAALQRQNNGLQSCDPACGWICGAWSCRRVAVQPSGQLPLEPGSGQPLSLARRRSPGRRPITYVIDTLFAAPDNDEIGMTDAVPMLGREAQVSNEVLEVVYVDRRAQRHLRAKRPRPCAEPAEADRAP